LAKIAITLSILDTVSFQQGFDTPFGKFNKMCRKTELQKWHLGTINVSQPNEAYGTTHQNAAILTSTRSINRFDLPKILFS